MHRTCRWLSLVLSLVLLLLLTACSSTSFFYNRLHFLLPWYLEDYVELNPEQDLYLDQLLATYLQQHRSQELPRYIAILDQAAVLLDREVSVQDMATLYSEVEQAGNRLQSSALEWMLALGAELSDAQIREFLEELQSKQQEYEDKYLDRDDEEFEEDVYDSLRKNTGNYLGRLNSAQRQQLQQASKQLKRSDALWLQERQAWIDSLQQLLQRQPGWQDELREAFAKRGENSDSRYREANAHNLQVIQTALAELLNSRTDKQDRRLRQELQDLRGELLMLIEQDGVDASGTTG